MFKKTIKFTDFNGKEQEKDFYFHLSKAEVAALAHGSDALEARMRRIEKAADGVAILNEMRAIIRLACGVRSEDGARFIKTPEAQSELMDSPAFDELVLELMDAGKMVEFFRQLIPDEVGDEFLKKAKELKLIDPFKEPEDKRPAYQREHRQPTKVELQSMTQQELMEAWAWKEQQNQ